MIPRVLIVAGSDSGGGAGIQADIKTVTALGGFATTAVTALTAQDTRGVHGVMPVPPAFIEQQMEVVLADLGTDAVKTGMLHSAAVIRTVAATLRRRAAGVPIVVDPVMVAKGGAPLLEPEARFALTELLLPLAAVLTPNLPEAEALTGLTITDEEGMIRAALTLLERGCAAVLVKGGHLPGDSVVDVLVTADGELRRWEDSRIDSRSTHGTGCTLASAIAVSVAEGLTLGDSVARARDYVRAAIRGAPGFGTGHGPLDHGHPLRQNRAHQATPPKADSPAQ